MKWCVRVSEFRLVISKELTNRLSSEMWWSSSSYSASVLLTLCVVQYLWIVDKNVYILPLTILYTVVAHLSARLQNSPSDDVELQQLSTRYLMTCGIVDGFSFFAAPASLVGLYYSFPGVFHALVGIAISVIFRASVPLDGARFEPTG